MKSRTVGLVAALACGVVTPECLGAPLVSILCDPMTGTSRTCGVEPSTRTQTRTLEFARELSFNDIFASRQSDSRTYILVGGGWLLGLRFGNVDQFVSKWLMQHPTATVKPISRMFSTNTRTKKTEESVYIWIEDGEISLNVDLVRAGLYPGAAMADMVDNQRGLDELLKSPELAEARAQVEKERAANPQDRAERLVSQDDYNRRVGRIELAEQQARNEKLGVWSDSMKEEREQKGYR